MMNSYQPYDTSTDSPAEGVQAEGLDGLNVEGQDPGALELDAVVNEGKKKSLTQSQMLLVVVLAVASGSLYLMRLSGGVRTADAAVTAVEVKIEKALAALSGTPSEEVPKIDDKFDQIFKDPETVIAMFMGDPTQKQVDINHIQRNPFELQLARENDSSSVVVAVDRVKEERVKQLRAELARMELQTIMDGQQPMAVVSGQVLRPGDMIGSFLVTSVGKGTVTLTAEGNTYNLTLKTGELKNKR